MSKYAGLKLAAEVALEDGPWEPRIGMTNCEKAFAQSASPAAILELIAENERLAAKAEKFAVIERVMEMLECDEREGGVWTACSLLLISSAHKMNSGRSVVDQEGVTVAGEQLGDWRLTVERIKEAAK